MYHGLSAPSLFDQGEIDTQKRYNNYQNRYHHRHVDLMDVMAMFHARHFQKLDDVAHLLGYPGKRGDGVYRIPEYVRNQQCTELTSYCEGDVLNTWLVYIRWLLLKGQLLLPDYQHLVKVPSSICTPSRNMQSFYQSGVKLHNALNLPNLISPSPHPRFS